LGSQSKKCRPGAPVVPAAIHLLCLSLLLYKQLLKLHLKQQGHYATPKIDQADVHKQQPHGKQQQLQENLLVLNKLLTVFLDAEEDH
jgi:hypothetical protein